MMETEMLEDHDPGRETSCKTLLIALGIPVDTFKTVASIHKDWRAKCH